MKRFLIAFLLLFTVEGLASNVRSIQRSGDDLIISTRDGQQSRTGATKNLIQFKSLTSNISSDDTSISELNFSNLIVGKFYRVTFHAKCNHLGTPDTQTTIDISVNHDGNVISSGSFSIDSMTVSAAPENKTNLLTASVVFQATTTSVTFGAVVRPGSGGASSILAGSAGQTNGTYTMLEELNNYQFTDKY